MKQFVSICLIIISSTFVFSQQEENTPTYNSIELENYGEHPIVRITTNKGDFFVKLYPKKTPVTVKNFLQYTEDNFYNNTVFHKVIDGFIIQGGGFTQHYKPKTSRAPIKNEASLGLKNTKGSLGMAVTSKDDSATSQFYINLTDNPELDFNEKEKGPNYTVFGNIIEGINVIEKIKKVKTKRISFYSDLHKRELPLYNVPEQAIIIKSVSVIKK